MGVMELMRRAIMWKPTTLGSKSTHHNLWMQKRYIHKWLQGLIQHLIKIK